MNAPKTEPVLTTSAVVTLATAVITLIVAFWPGLLSEDQKLAILGLVSVVAPIVLGAVVRPKVTPNASVVERAEGNTVIAGPANDMKEAGTTIRTIVPVE